MKKRWTTQAATLAALSLILGLISCSGGSKGLQAMAPAMMDEEASGALRLSTGFEPMGPPGASETAKVASGQDADQLQAGEGALAPAALEGRKLVKTARLEIRVDELEAAMRAAQALAQSLGGYVSNTNSGLEWASLTIRVPQASFESALASLGPLGEVLNRSENAEDVTVRFADLEGRLKTKKALADTFRSYLRKAQSIEDILAVEERLADLQAQIDGTGQELRGLSDRIDFATINVQFSIPASRAPVHREGLGERLAKLLGGFGSFMAGLATVLVGIIVYGIPILALAAALWWLLFGKLGLIRKLWALISPKRKAT